MFRTLGIVSSSMVTACGAIMLTQAVYDPGNASASFWALGACLAAVGIYGGVWMAKNA